MHKIDISVYKNEFSLANKLARFIWFLVYSLLFRFSPIPFFAFRRSLLRLFGAKIGHKASIYPSTKIWAPWNLVMGNYSCLSHDVDCYCVDKITLKDHATVSQYSFLCTATHDTADRQMRLVTSPISIGEGAWVCANVFVGPGVTIGEGAVAGACSVVVSIVEPWTIVAGNPARFIKKRILNDNDTINHTAAK